MTYAIVLMNLGGPNSPEEVEPFLFSLFNDPAIISLPTFFRKILARFISKRRTPKAQGIYALMGGKSPILLETIAQAKALEKKMHPLDVKVFIAMRHAYPRTEVAVEEVRKLNPEKIILLPLYPQFSDTTTGSAVREWVKLAPDLQHKTTTLCCYPDLEGVIKPYADGINESLLKHQDKPCVVLLSAHGLPEKNIKSGDPYQKQVELTAKSIVNLINTNVNVEFKICYQSRVGPLKWIGPSTEDCIKSAGEKGQGIVICPIAFVSEHSETLVELDIEYKHLADENKVPFYERVPTLSSNELFINSLADECKKLINTTGIAKPSSNIDKICCQNSKKCPHQGNKLL